MHLWVPNLTESCTIGPKRHGALFSNVAALTWCPPCFGGKFGTRGEVEVCNFAPSLLLNSISLLPFSICLSISLSLSIVPPRYLKHLSGPLHPYRPFHSDPPHGGRIHLTGPKSFERRWAPTHHLHRVRFEDGGETQISATMECRTNLLLLPIA